MEHLRLNIGLGRHLLKRKRNGNKVETVTVSYNKQGRNERIYEQETPKKSTDTMSAGRPTQIHAVPAEERAFNSKGIRLPWGLEWPEYDHLTFI